MFLLSDPPIVPRFTLEVRERFERRLDKDYFSGTNDNRSDLFTRIRPGLEFKYGRLTAYIQGQYAHDWAWTSGKTFTTENRDASQAFLRIDDASGSVTFGRQKINIGNERLIGSLEWVNTSRSYDGVRFQSKRWDLFVAKIGNAIPHPRDARIAGAVHNWKAGQSMLALKHDDVAGGPLDIWTLDHLGKGIGKRFDYDYEVAIQGGQNAGKDHQAWALHGTLGKSLNLKDRIYIEVNAASGGHDGDKSETFDNLYPTNHKFYGSMDMQAWKNMRELAVGWQRKVDAKTSVFLHGHFFELMDCKDAWYGAAGVANKRVGGVFKDPTGASGKSIGTEWDLEATYKLDSKTTLQGGFGLFEPSSFIKRMNGGSADHQTWFYIQASWKL